MDKPLFRLLIKGGILSPGELLDIIDLAERQGLEHLYFGSRQDILLDQIPPVDQLPEIVQKHGIEQLGAAAWHNVMSAYVASDIFSATPWVLGSTYLYVLEQLHNPIGLEINVVDPRQQMVPLFSGHLNFIASPHEDYWYVYVKLPEWSRLQRFPVLVNTWDIGRFCYAIEQCYRDHTEVDSLFAAVNMEVEGKNRTIETDLRIPFQPFPYYEGMNRMGLDHYWLGLYWRNNRYDLRFLRAMCARCLEDKIGQICITPWKSFIVKGIPTNSRFAWEKFLGNYGINVRHSSLELNWRLPVANEEALELKRYLVRNFDQNDISTYGLTFAIEQDKRPYFTSIVIRCNPLPVTIRNFEFRPTYDVLHADRFDPNTLQYKVYAQDIDKIELPGLLMELCLQYWKQLEDPEQLLEVVEMKESDEIDHPNQVSQCQDCLSVYDVRVGDPGQHISKGTDFEALPATFACSVCGAPRERFQWIRLDIQLG